MSAVDFLVTTPIPEPGMSLLHSAGKVEVATQLLTAPELEEACASGHYRVVVAQLRDRFDREVLDDARITGISNYAVGYNNIDITAATDRSIMVANTPGVLTDATADIAVLLILAVARRCVEADRFVRDGRFTGWEPNYCSGTT